MTPVETIAVSAPRSPWIANPRWDLTGPILSAALVPLPILATSSCRRPSTSTSS